VPLLHASLSIVRLGTLFGLERQVRPDATREVNRAEEDENRAYEAKQPEGHKGDKNKGACVHSALTQGSTL